MKVAIVKYNAGNIFSVVNALKRIDVEPIITDDHHVLRMADCVILPGQGSAATTMAALHDRGLDTLLPQLKQPVLGICVGQQLLCEYSEEGNTQCLGIFKGVCVKRFVALKQTHKVPHMGWNNIERLHDPLFAGIQEEDFVYYIHSYYAPVNEYTIATTHYIVPFSGAMQRDNFYATQFHPEKSGDVGERILSNFIEIAKQT
ncbi:MAG: imidazole glycerol phosphate synthase subunit HisH [Bacteroidales bacterium]|nr:imidazole glycerol phosphate synthase subunit HisH [Bacteroidales bacterium]